MLLTTANPTFVLYVVTVLALNALLLFLWAWSGFVRGRTKTAINPEDGRQYGATVVEHNPPEVARVLRAHANALTHIYPFLFFGLVFVCLGGGRLMAAIVFGSFTLLRVLHAVIYLAGKQPWRTVCFILSNVPMVALFVDIVRRLARA